jgi:hypothetical protein
MVQTWKVEDQDGLTRLLGISKSVTLFSSMTVLSLPKDKQTVLFILWLLISLAKM